MRRASCRAEEMLIRDESLLSKKNGLFQKLTETTNSAIFVLREKFLYVNPAAVAITGYSEEELLAMPGWEAIIHADYQQLLKDRASARLAGKSVPQRDEVCIITRDGETRWLDYTANVIEHNGAAAILGTAIDITAKRNAESRLRLSEEKYSKTFQSSPAIVCMSSPEEGVMIEANLAFERTFGFTRDQIINHSSRELGIWPNWNDRRILLQQIREQGSIHELELRFFNSAGKPIYLLGSVDLIHIDGCSRLLMVAQDITTRIQDEQLRQQQMKQLQTFHRGMQELATNAAIGEGRIAEAMNEVSRVTRDLLNVWRVSIWRVDESAMTFNCEGIYPQPEDVGHADEWKLPIGDLCEYQHSLGKQLIQSMGQDDNSEITRLFLPYLKAFKISSGLCVVVHIGGEPIGLMMLECIDSSRTWSLEERGFVVSIAEVAALAWDQYQRVEAENMHNQERRLAELTLNSIGDGVIRTDNSGFVVYMNQIASEILGVGSEHALGQPVTGLVRLLDEISNASADSIIDDALVLREPGKQTKHIVRLLGREQIYEIKLSPIASPDDGVSGIVIVLHDITELRVMAKQLSYQVTHDDLTGLINRRSFEESLTVILDQVHTQKRKHVLCYIDLDRFKYINDAGGHLAGDELLRQISVLMQRYVTATDILARLGSDEFVIIYEDCTLHSAIEEAKELQDAIRNFVFRWQGKSYYIGASMGIVRLGKDIGTLRDVMTAADAACYAAKGSGRDRIHVFTRNDIESSQRQDEVKWLEHIRDSITQQHFVLYYQTIEAISDRVKSHGRHCELLLRMHSNDGDLVLPQDFILVAERYNLMPMLDRWVVSKALSVIANDAITSEMKMDEFSINLSGQSIGDDRFLEYVIDQIRQSGVDPRKLCFEVTETAAIANMDSASKFLTKLRKLGCKFALDDFGRGLSSFSYLKNLTVDYLKIDGSFIRDLNYDSTDWAMVEAINQVGHAMNIPTVAEYVSDYDILSAVKKLGIDFAQGLHISVPCPVPGSVGIITETKSPPVIARSSQNK